MKVYSNLSAEERKKRRPPPPEDLMGALHDDISKPPTKCRAVKAARAKRHDSSDSRLSEGK